jgi:hypothetical protein
MFLLDKVKPLYFMVALCFGLFMTYIFTPPPKVIYKYPTPDNVEQLTYIDGGEHCFKYKATEVKCPKNPKEIYTIPVQSDISASETPNQ